MHTVASRIEKFTQFMGKDLVSLSMITDLKLGGFFHAPASTKYHGAYPGGLFDHSLEVAESLVWLTNHLRLEWENPRSPKIVGMFHDLCKLDQYQSIKVFKANSEFNAPEEFNYEYNKNTLLKGHGAKSVMLLSTYYQLTLEEVMCIRYHMGAYDKDDWNEYDLAIKEYNNVLYTHTADMIASKIKGV